MPAAGAFTGVPVDAAMSMPEWPAPGWPLYTRPLPKRPLMRPCSGHWNGAAKSARSSSRVRAAVTRACSRRMRSAIAGGGFTVFGGTPSTRSSGQSRASTAMVSVVAVPSARSTSSRSGPAAWRSTPNTTVP